METGIIIFFNSESHSFFVDGETSLASLKEHVVQSFGLDKDAQLVLKTLDESLTLSSDQDLRTVCSQVDADDFVLLSTFVVEPSSPSSDPDPVSVEASSSSLNVEAEEPKKEQEEVLEFPAFIQDVMRQMKVDPQVTKKKAERAFNKINAKCPGLITSDSVRHINGLLNQLSSNLEKHKDEINDLANSLDRSSSSSSSSSSGEGAVPPSFNPLFRFRHGEAMRGCRKQREDRAEESKSTEPQTPSSSSSDRQMHHAMCDNCSKMIEGVRFKCTVCPDFDLCAKCEDSDTKHNPDHLFVKMKRPVDAIHFNNHQKQSNTSTPPPFFPHHPAFGRRGGPWGGNGHPGPHFFGAFPPCHPGFGPGPEPRPFCPRDAPGSGPRGWWHERKNLHERVETLEKTLSSLEAKLDRLL